MLKMRQDRHDDFERLHKVGRIVESLMHTITLSINTVRTGAISLKETDSSKAQHLSAPLLHNVIAYINLKAEICA